MLNDIGLGKNLIIIITAYFKKVCLKDFIDSKTFKSFLLQLNKGNNESTIKLLFELFTYPKKNISVNDFIKLSKQFEILNSNEIGI